MECGLEYDTGKMFAERWGWRTAWMLMTPVIF